MNKKCLFYPIISVIIIFTFSCGLQFNNPFLNTQLKNNSNNEILIPIIAVKENTNDIPNSGSFNFPDQKVGYSSIVRFYIRNIGKADLIINTISCDNSTDFSFTNLSSIVIPPSDDASFDITFSPTSLGLKTANITITSNAQSNSIYRFMLTGTGILPQMDVKQGVISIASGTGSYDFGNIEINSNSEVTFAIDNLNTSFNLLLTGSPKVLIAGVNSDQFSITLQPSSPIAPSSSSSFKIKFSPTVSAGLKTATISIANDSNQNPYTFTITGTAITPEIDVNQASTPIASGGTYNLTDTTTDSSRLFTFTIENNGTSNLTLGTLTLTGADVSDFTLAQPSSASIIPGGNTTFTLTFHPSKRGTKNAIITIPNNDINENPYIINVTGNAVLYVSWTQVSTLSGVVNLKAQNEYVFAQSYSYIYRSDYQGITWNTILSAGTTVGSYVVGTLNGIDADSSNFYVATGNNFPDMNKNGVLKSIDNGSSYSWSFYWQWDNVVSVDFQNGIGWCTVNQTGSISGPNKYNGSSWGRYIGDLPPADYNTYKVIADSVDPANIAYIACIFNKYRTINGGINWTVIPAVVIFDATDSSGDAIAYTNTTYSTDHGDTWLPLGLYANTFVKEDLTNLLFAGTGSGLYFKDGGSWSEYGLSGLNIQSLAVCVTTGDDYLFAVDSSGNIYRTNLTYNFTKM